MSPPAAWRPVLAAGLMLAVLAGAYERARRRPYPAPPPLAEPAPADTLAAEPVVAPPTPSPAPSVPSPEVAEPALPRCRPRPLRFAEKTAQLGPRRYVGTVDGQPATAEVAEVAEERPGRLRGRIYFWRTGQEYNFVQPSRRRPRRLKLSAPSFPSTSRAGGWWRLSQRPGPVLQGTWVDSAGQQPRPFVLRESYQGGVRYEIRQLTLTGGSPVSHNSCDVPTCSRDFLHLLGPAAGRPPLGCLQWPAPATRRRLVRHDYNQEVHFARGIEVLLNDFGLLSYRTFVDDMPFAGSSSSSRGNGLLDLTTGQRLSVYGQLQADYERPLRRLITRHALLDFGYTPDHHDACNGWEWETVHGRRVPLAPLPNEAPPDAQWGGDGCSLTAQGLHIHFEHPFLVVLLPYAELRPLVRPGTPLAGMLRARGLW